MPQILIYLGKDEDEEIISLKEEWRFSNKTDVIVKIIKDYLRTRK
ncbi:MAG: hypothetical protein ACFFKA_18625 [Candidatus Thorarchaeota archaeon]